MIAAWNSHLLIASLTLTALTALSVLLTRRILWRQPAIAHGFLVFVLLGFVITLPMQFSSKELVKASQAKEQARAELQERTESFPVELVPVQVPFDYFLDGDNEPAEAEVETAGFYFDDVEKEEGGCTTPKEGATILENFAPSPFLDEDELDLGKGDLFAGNVVEDSAAEERPEFKSVDDTGEQDTSWARVAQFLAPVVRSPWLLAIHVIGLLIALAVEFLRYRKTNRIVRRASPIIDPRTLQIWEQIAGRSAKKVQLLASTEVRAPVCWGIARPVVIVPADEPVGRETAAFKWAIRHELVHLRRGDPRTTLFQSVLRAVFWFHPASWWLNREIDRLREISCDDAVVGRTGSRKSYAMALIEYARQRDARAQTRTLSPTAPALIAWSGSSSQLERRIRMLAQTNDTRPRSARLLQAAGAVGVALMLLSAQVTWAANMPTPQSEPEAVATDAPVVEIEVIEEEPQEEPKAVDATEPRVAVAGRIVDATGLPVEATVRTADGPIAGRIVQDSRDTLTIGVHLQPFSNSLAKTLGMPSGSGLLITKVVKGSNAERAGLKKDDPILKIDGEYASMDQIRAAKKRSGGKKPIKFVVMRGAKIKTITVHFKSAKKDNRRNAVGFGGGGVVSRSPRSGVSATEAVPGPSRSGGGFGGAFAGPTAPTHSGVPADPRRMPAVAHPGSRSSNKEKQLEREVRHLNRRLDRLTRSLERQGEMLERLMREPRRSSRSPENTRSRFNSTKDAYNRSAADLERLRRKEAAEVRAAERTLRTKERSLYRRELAEKEAAMARMDAERRADAAREHADQAHALRKARELAKNRLDGTRAEVAAKKRAIELERLAVLENHQAQQKAELQDLLARKSAELAESSARLNHVESALAQLEAQYADISAQRAEIAASKLATVKQKEAVKALAAAEEDLKRERESLFRRKAETADQTATIRAHRKAMIAEYEAKIADLENQTEMLRRQMSKKKKKSPKKRVVNFDDDFKSDGQGR